MWCHKVDRGGIGLVLDLVLLLVIYFCDLSVFFNDYIVVSVSILLLISIILEFDVVYFWVELHRLLLDLLYALKTRDLLVGLVWILGWLAIAAVVLVFLLFILDDTAALCVEGELGSADEFVSLVLCHVINIQLLTRLIHLGQIVIALRYFWGNVSLVLRAYDALLDELISIELFKDVALGVVLARLPFLGALHILHARCVFNRERLSSLILLDLWRNHTHGFVILVLLICVSVIIVVTRLLVQSVGNTNLPRTPIMRNNTLTCLRLLNVSATATCLGEFLSVFCPFTVLVLFVDGFKLDILHVVLSL